MTLGQKLVEAMTEVRDIKAGRKATPPAERVGIVRVRKPRRVSPAAR